MFQIGTVYRYATGFDPKPLTVDGLPNYFNVVRTENSTLAKLDKGINPVGKVSTSEGTRTPAILISSSPHKIGSATTPWQDFFDPDNGHIRYYGDNKNPGTDSSKTLGNAALLAAFRIHSALEYDIRKHSIPVIFFKRVKYEGRIKGNVVFQGFGIIERVELITQYDQKHNRSFPNYVFDFAVFGMSAENELFSWDWISARRNENLLLKETLELAPATWKTWLKKGTPAINSCRRKVSKIFIEKTENQKPEAGSREAKDLNEIYKFYENRKSHFEALAAVVTERILQKSGGTYHFGWITQSGSDSGIDFVGRLDLGSEFSKVKIIVLGQAKCEKPTSPTNGVHLARTVARLRRGWIGAYVTTSYFSEASQAEVIEDQYPLLLVHGLRLAREVRELMLESGFNSIKEYLGSVDKQHDGWLRQRRAEEILLD
jgi:hypothetical protein